MITLTRDKLVTATYTLAGILLITLPDVFGHIILGALHLALEIAHLVFEFLEIMLDHVIEHLFETDLHTTQVIVFWTLVTFLAIPSIFIIRALYRYARRLVEHTKLTYEEKKTQANVYWHQLGWFKKAELITLAATGLTVLVMLEM